ncbi:MAG: FtsQ-type POTRA domain-containing protein [Aeromicrobium sp.]
MSEQRFAVRRRESRWRRVRIYFYVALALVLVGTLIWLVWFSAILGVRHVKVEGMETLKAHDISVKAAIGQGQPLARVDTSSAEARVASLERIETVDIHRSWPNTITVKVVERHAVAWIRADGTIRGLDRFGVDFRDYSGPPKGLFEVRVLAFDSTRRQAALVEAAKVIGIVRTHDPDLYGVIRHVNVASKDSVELVLSRVRIVRWGSAAHSDQKLAVLRPLLRIKARTYDVTAPEQPTTKQ